MRVNQNQSAAGQEVSGTRKSNSQTKAYAKGDKNAAAAAMRGDGAPQISEKAKQMAAAKTAAAQAPDVREDRVAELKKKIASGSYKVDANAIADRMVDDHLSAV